MGEGQLLAAAALIPAVVAFAAGLPAQGVAYRERWGFLHLEERWAELRAQLAGRDGPTTQRVAELLAAPDGGVPFVPVARALASLRGVAADDAFVLRTTLGMYVLPEVCDPDGANEVCRTTNLSAFLPFTVPAPGEITCEVVVTDAAGKVVCRETLSKDTGVPELRMGRAVATVPGGELPDGCYTATLSARIGGNGPAAADPVRVWTFHVLRGYQARAEQALRAARERADALPGTERARVLGAAAAVARAYHGEAFVGRSDGVRELQRLEAVLANVDAGRPAGTGVEGEVVLALPAGGGPPLAGVLRPHAGGEAPLLVFVAGTPTYDGLLNRPAAPATRDPGWSAREFAAFATVPPMHLAFLESPGGGRDFAGALLAALPLLGELVATGGRKPLLLCEREAAAVVALRIAAIRPLVSGLVFTGGGAMTAKSLQDLGDLPVRVAATKGPAEASLQSMFTWVANQQGKLTVDLQWLSDARPAWQLGLPAFGREIAAFAGELFRR